MTQEEFFTRIGTIYADCLDIVHKKNADYSTSTDPFKNFRFAEMVGITPERAILVRMSDKLARISNLIDKQAQVKTEAIEDTLADLINYSAILITYLESKQK